MASITEGQNGNKKGFMQFKMDKEKTGGSDTDKLIGKVLP